MQGRTASSRLCAVWAVVIGAAAIIPGGAATAFGQAATQGSGDDYYYLHKGDVVLMLGDALTSDNYYSQIFYDDLRKHYPQMVIKEGQAKPAENFEGPSVRFVDGGVRGDTAGDALKRVEEAIKTSGANVCVVCLGINDRLKDRANYAINLRKIVQKLKAAKVAVTILTAPCVSTAGHPEVGKYIEVMAEFAEAARKIADEEGVGLADAYAITRDFMENKKQDFSIGDGVHPNRAGQRMMCDALEEAWGLGKPLGDAGTPRLRPWPPKKAPASQPTAQPTGAAGPGVTPAPGATPTPSADLSKRKEEWVNVTTNVGGNKWGIGGVTVLAVVPGREEVVAGVSDAGMWYTGDGGASWRKLAKGVLNTPRQVLFDPKDTKAFWVTADSGGGVFRSLDTGKSFEQLGKLANVAGLSVDFGDPTRSTLLAGANDKPRSLYKSTDGGRTWTDIGPNLPEKTNFTTDPVILDEKTYLVNAAGPKLELTFGIFRTDDAGKTWKTVGDYAPVGQPLRSADGSMYWGQIYGQGLLKSADGGKTWTAMAGEVKKTPIDVPVGRLVGVEGQQLYWSGDGAKSWKPCGPKIPGPVTGIVYNQMRNSIFAWFSSGDQKVDNAVWRLDLPTDLGTFFK
ncbi:MAG: GDSL-type esterase/lipase family protein [Phycisphaerae bacterium]